MKKQRKIISCVLVIVLVAAGGVGWFFSIATPQMQGELLLPGIQNPVSVYFDDFANPTIKTDKKTDAYYALGFLTARERMFQMDLMRRKAAGRLSEIFGQATLKFDITNRYLGFQRVATNIIRELPDRQRKILRAYVDGINAYLQSLTILPFEFLILGYTPEPWKEEDSLLISLGMFQTLNHNDADERMLTVMKAALPDDVYQFLTPQYDIYNASVLLVGEEANETDAVIPVKSLYKINLNNAMKVATGLVGSSFIIGGSNQWVVNKTADGRAILANDMHLPLTVPNLWYRAALHYDDVTMTGITLPGLPLIIAGSNGFIAWGYTNAHADVLDLVTLKINPQNRQQYRTKRGWRNFAIDKDIIKVKNAPDHVIHIKRTVWGPVSPNLLMGKEVAVQWTVFNEHSVDLDLADMDKTRDMDEALRLFNNAGLPVLNVALADKEGNIAWTLTGRMPKRVNLTGNYALPWDKENIGWDGFIKAQRYPQVKNPSSGFLQTANNRVLAHQHQFVYGQNFSNSFRAFRIAELLTTQQNATEESVYAMQLDNRSEFFDFYRQLALSVLSETALVSDPELYEVKQAIENWNGAADADSIGFGLLVEFRRQLADIVLSAYVQQCRELEADFKYRWFEMDTPLRLLLAQKVAETLPGKRDYASWNDLILAALKQVARNIKRRFPAESLANLKWGEMNSFQLRHPFSHSYPWVGRILDMAKKPLVGCLFCVRVATKNFAASMRLVVSPGHEDEMILIQPTGQSGLPFSENYRDQYNYWVNGWLMKEKKLSKKRKLILMPQASQLDIPETY